MKKGTVIYCHGFASSGKNPKSAALVEEFGEDNVATPDIPIDPVTAEELLDKIIATELRKGKEVVLVGTSLGGFWANYLAHKWLLPCVMVNPSVDPDVAMATRVSKPMNNYVTGEPILVTDADVAAFAKRKNSKAMSILIKDSYLFVAKDDDVLDYRVALARLDATSITVKDEGGHRFEQHWPEVISVVKKLLS